MQITLQYFDGCPNWQVARDRLAEALRLAGRGDVRVKLHQVETPEDAERIQFQGSPTLLIDGQDPFPHDSGPGGLSCRLYAGLEGVPSVAQLVAAVRTAT